VGSSYGALGAVACLCVPPLGGGSRVPEPTGGESDRRLTGSAMNPHNMGLKTRDRLLLAFANLASYGIDTYPAVEGDLESARAQLEAECRPAHPDGLLSYVFWLRSDEATLFQQGELPPGCALPLFYHSRARSSTR